MGLRPTSDTKYVNQLRNLFNEKAKVKKLNIF